MIFIYHVVFSNFHNFHPVFLSGAIIDLVFVGLYTSLSIFWSTTSDGKPHTWWIQNG
jgi:hypothetical protein